MSCLGQRTWFLTQCESQVATEVLTVYYFCRFFPLLWICHDLFLIFIYLVSYSPLVAAMIGNLFCVLIHGSANSFCKRPDTKYFRFWGSYNFFFNYSVWPLWYKSNHKHYANAQAWLYAKYVYIKQLCIGMKILQFSFVRKYYFDFFPNHLKM